MTTLRDIRSENVDMINNKSCEIPQAFTLDQTPIKKLGMNGILLNIS
jgi:hypothetical protein